MLVLSKFCYALLLLLFWCLILYMSFYLDHSVKGLQRNRTNNERICILYRSNIQKKKKKRSLKFELLIRHFDSALSYVQYYHDNNHLCLAHEGITWLLMQGDRCHGFFCMFGVDDMVTHNYIDFWHYLEISNFKVLQYMYLVIFWVIFVYNNKFKCEIVITFHIIFNRVVLVGYTWSVKYWNEQQT